MGQRFGPVLFPFMAVVGIFLMIGLCPVLAQDRPSGPPPSGSGPDGSGGSPDSSSGPPKPPPEAYKACEGKTAGATAQMVGRRGEMMNGTCVELGGTLVLLPDFMKNRQGKKPNE